MLSKFLEDNKTEILALAEEKTLNLAGSLTSSKELRKGLPVFYDHLIAFLKNSVAEKEEHKIAAGAAGHGRELLRLNYSLSHVVHAYGAMCQAITELAQRKNATITSQDFNDLNLCLDIAIASAVSEYQFQSIHAIHEREVQHLGFLVHELRNALSSATIAHGMIKQGLVGTGGSTAKILEENLFRMRVLIDRSLSEVRMKSDPDVFAEKFLLNTLVDQILLTAESEAQNKRQILENEISTTIELETDRQLLLSAIANLIQNALKYTKAEGHILVSSSSSNNYVSINIKDQCGGIPDEISKNLFKPFSSGGFDQSGLGLGLTIVQRAVWLLQGQLTVKNLPQDGCCFTIEIPVKLGPKPPRKTPVPGADSVHPQTHSRRKK